MSSSPAVAEPSLDRFLGAWLGRAAGCALGKPFELSPYTTGLPGRPGWAFIRDWYRANGSDEVDGYAPPPSAATRAAGLPDLRSPRSWRGSIEGLEPDDDLRYTVLGLELLEARGLDWDAWDVGALWHERLSLGQVWTAERVAYLNLGRERQRLAADPERGSARRRALVARVARRGNPHREWIGALIRVDAYAYAAAGDPELAAELARRDAVLSHAGTGVHAAAYTASLVALAFARPVGTALVEEALRQVPGDGRLARAVRAGLEAGSAAKTQADLAGRLWERFGRLGWVHALNNASLVAASLAYGGGDFGRTLCAAVAGGWDSDCNGATAGSVLGAALGAAALPASWIEPLGDRIETGLAGPVAHSIRDLAHRSRELHLRLRGTARAAGVGEAGGSRPASGGAPSGKVG